MPYSHNFYHAMQVGSNSSAGVIVPMVVNLLHPKSVVDVGCGEGLWLAHFLKCGINDVLGIDGEYVQLDRLAIPRDKFLGRDLYDDWGVTREFDLACCLEVAEHLNETFADELIRRLVTLAPLCLFSAAIPHQGGTHHVNEQWQDYWAGKFVKHGFRVIDAIRNAVWAHPDVGYVYSQNVILYCNMDACARYELLAFEHKGPWQRCR